MAGAKLLSAALTLHIVEGAAVGDICSGRALIRIGWKIEKILLNALGRIDDLIP